MGANPARDIIDIDGDGVQELLVVGRDELLPRARWYALRYSPATTGAPLRWVEVPFENADSSLSGHNLVRADLNGDGLLDLAKVGSILPGLGYDGRTAHVWLNTGNGAFMHRGLNRPVPGSERQPACTRLKRVAPFDYNTDGRSDLLESWDCPDFWYNVALKPNGDVTAFTHQEVPEIQAYFPDTAPGLHPASFDGIADLDRDGNADLFGHIVLYGKGAKATLLNKIVDGVGNVVNVSYGNSVSRTADCAGTTTATWPEQCLRSVTGLVSSHSEGFLDKNGAEVVERTYHYTYTNPRVSVTGHGWLGFDRRTITQQVPTPGYTFPTTVSETTIEYESFTPTPLESADGTYRHLYLFAGLPKTVTVVQGLEPNPVTPPLQTAPYERITEVENTWEDKLSTGGFHFPALTGRTTSIYERKRTSGPIPIPPPDPPPPPAPRQQLSFCVEEMVPDGYGNTRYHSRDCRIVEDSEEFRETTIDYDAESEKLQSWLIALPKEVTVRSSRYGEVQTQSWSSTFDGQGRLRTLTRAQAGASGETHHAQYVPDAFGNVTEIIETVTNESPRTTAITYDSENLFPAVITNSLNHTTQLDFDRRFGAVITAVDANAVVTQRAYDALGLLSEVRGPGGSSRYSYESISEAQGDVETPAGTIHPRIRVSVTREGLSGSPTGGMVSELDNYGRLVWSSGEGFGGALIVQERAFDARGRLSGATLPHPPGAAQILSLAYTYDELNRLTEVAFSDGRPPVKHQYATGITLRPEHQQWLFFDNYVRPLEVQLTIDPACGQNTNSDCQRNLVATGLFGLVLRSIDGENIDSTAKAINYRYGAFNRLRSIAHRDFAGNAETLLNEFTYDSYGRQLTQTDPDTGSTTNTYNGFDELKTSLDAVNQLRTYTYDALGRPTSIIDSVGQAVTGTTSWVYDQGTNALGRVSEMISPATLQNPNGARVRYIYEPLAAVNRGLLKRVDYDIDGSEYSIGFTYDDHARPQRIDYPTPVSGPPVAAEYHYDTSGILTSLNEVGSGTTKPIWQLNDAYEGQLIERETFGNGAITQYWYEPGRNWVEVIKTTIGTQTQQLGYTYRDNGQILDRTRPGLSTRHSYDALGRLKSTLDNASGETTTTIYDYDQLGNLSTRESATYDQLGNLIDQRTTNITSLLGRPHLINTVDSNNYGYDAKGNLTSRFGPDIPGSSQTISYTPFDLPSRIQTFSDTTEFEYTADEERLVRRTVRPTETETIHFVSDLYRRVDTVGASTGAREDHFRLYAGGRQIAEIVRSSTGSTSTLYFHADHQGSVNVISTDTGTSNEQRYDVFGGPLDGSGIVTRTGYTGHQHDRELGFIDMRGRMYDPLAARFVSADPIIQAPYFSQGLNRYAYVFNDPVNLTDPSGFQVFSGANATYTTFGGELGLTVHANGALNPAGGVPALPGSEGSALGALGAAVALGAHALTWSGLPWDSKSGYSKSGSLGNQAGKTTQATQSASNAQTQNNGSVGPDGYVPPAGLGELLDFLLQWLNSGKTQPGADIVDSPDTYVPLDDTKPQAGEAGGAKKPPGSTRAELVTAPNWRSRPQFGHTFSVHGQGDKITKSLTGRAAGTKTPQGQWLNNDAAAKWIAKNVRGLNGSAGFRLPEGMGQVIMPNGQVVPANGAEIWLTEAGTVRTAFPILIP